MRRALTGIAATVLLAAALLPTLGLWAAGFALPVLALLVSQVVLAASAGLLATTVEHRRAAVLVALGVLAIGVPNLNSPTFESWGHASMVGFAFQWLPVGFLLPVLLTFPGQRLDRLGVGLVVAVWVVLVLGRVLATPLWDPAWMGYTGPARWLTYPGLESRALSDAALRLESVALWVLGVVSVVAFVRRWRSASGLARAPVRVVSVAGVGLSLAVPLNGLSTVRADAGVVSEAAYLVQNLLLLLMPLGLLTVATWSALRRGALVEELTARAGDPSGVQAVLAAQLHDPDLRVAFRARGRWLDAVGCDLRTEPAGPFLDGVSMPCAAGPGRHWELLRGVPDGSGGAVVAAVDLADDASTDPGRVRVALRAAALVLDNTSLAVEREAHLAELTAAQSRIVEAGLAERRRLERDLHDGAQQQLLAVSTTLSRARLLAEPSQVGAVVDEAQDQLSGVLAELRRLAHGIHPGAVSQGGLGLGLESLMRVDPRVRLELDEAIKDGVRLHPDVESAAWFVAAESTANAVKHSGATAITVTAALDDDPAGLHLAVTDDGVGGAMASGAGLTGLRDRVRALGGSLDVADAADGGTRVAAWLPLGRPDPEAGGGS